MQNDDWFPCYPAKLTSNASRLCPHDFGAYWRLLCDYYQNGPLPDDDEALRRISGVDAHDWARTKGNITVHPFFEQNGDGKWHQKRADEIIKERNELVAKKRAQTAVARALNPKNNPTDTVTGSVTNPVTDTETEVQVQVHRQVQVQRQKQVHPHGVSASVASINARAELERVEARIKEVKEQGTQVAGSPMRYTVPQRAELKALKDRREQLKEQLGFQV